MQQKTYTETYTIQNVDVDFNRMLKPSALLRYAERISAAHICAEGHGEDFLTPQGLALLVGRQALRFERVPLCGETLAFTTYPEQSRHGSMKRVTSAVDKNGQLVAMVDARWMLVDVRQGRILREPCWDTTPYWFDKVEAELPQQVHRVRDEKLENVGPLMASYSLCDENGHINNSCYLDIACDALPLDTIKQGRVVFAALKYNREVPFGSQMNLLRAPVDGGWYVAGQRDGRGAFECYLELKQL